MIGGGSLTHGNPGQPRSASRRTHRPSRARFVKLDRGRKSAPSPCVLALMPSVVDMRHLAVLSVLMSFFLVACGSTATESAERVASGHGGTVSLDFTAKTVAGDAFDGSSLAGKPTVFWFWAPWCPTCRSQITPVSDLAHKHGDEVNVVGVGSLDDEQAISGFADQVGAEVVELADPGGAVWRHFAVTAQSTYLVLDADGTQVAKGSLDDAELADLVDQLVG